jgi:hypothetical protein
MGRMSFATLLSDTPPAYATAVTAPMMQMVIAVGDEDDSRCKEQVVVEGGGEEARQI